ncbi:hypothetical protein U1Q18_004712 [Sarracenia purpurea var. burkii]
MACKKFSKILALAQMPALQEQVNFSESIEKEVKVLKLKQVDEGIMDKLVEAKLVELQGKAEQCDELRKQLEKEMDFRLEEATKTLNSVKLEVESKRRLLESRHGFVEAVVAEVHAINMMTYSVKELGAAKQQELLRKYEELCKR